MLQLIIACISTPFEIKFECNVGNIFNAIAQASTRLLGQEGDAIHPVCMIYASNVAKTRRNMFREMPRVALAPTAVPPRLRL